MADNVESKEKKTTVMEQPPLEERNFWPVIIGVVIVIIITVLVFRAIRGILVKPAGEKKAITTSSSVENVTMEATIEQNLPVEKTYLITSKAGFKTLTYTLATVFVSENGQGVSPSVLKPGMVVSAEGKAVGGSFEAKKITVLKGNAKTTPTPFKLPGTGIEE